MVSKYNLATIKGGMLTVSWKAENIEWNKR